MTPELQDIKAYINTNTVSIKELVGKKIIMVDFWTYSCSNCQRTIPYLNSWYEKYKDKGLEIIGVHTPEFDFEKNVSNVETAVVNYGIKYPVVLDNNYATWRAYNNRYWPHKYLINLDGKIVYDHIGEGSYENTEKKIQELLEERMKLLGEKGKIEKDMTPPANIIKADVTKPISPETYFGASRNEFLVNGKAFLKGNQVLKAPAGVVKNRLYLIGDWNINDEYAENVNAAAEIVYRYEGKAVYIVAGSDRQVRFRVGRDGGVIGSEKGKDVDENGWVRVEGSRLYHIVNDSEYGEHTLEIIIESPGLQVFTFTFG